MYVLFYLFIFSSLDNRSAIYQPWDFLVYSSLSLFIISIFVVFIWHVLTYKKYRNFSTPLQKTLTALPYISLIYSLCLYNYFNTIENISEKILFNFLFYLADIDDKSIAIRSYLITILITLSSIYRTIFWFLMIIISYVKIKK